MYRKCFIRLQSMGCQSSMDRTSCERLQAPYFWLSWPFSATHWDRYRQPLCMELEYHMVTLILSCWSLFMCVQNYAYTSAPTLLATKLWHSTCHIICIPSSAIYSISLHTYYIPTYYSIMHIASLLWSQYCWALHNRQWRSLWEAFLGHNIVIDEVCVYYRL